MKVEILGSAGAGVTPRALCTCHVCVEAREKGPPYARMGPSVFVHGPDLLVDTPEESNLQLSRAGIEHVAGCFYSHWHPDHTMGRRVFETIGADWRGWPPEQKQTRTTRIYLPQQVAQDFRERRGLWEHFAYMGGQGWVEVVEVADGEVVELGNYTVQPWRLAEDYVYCFLVVGDGKRLLLAPDELNGWSPPPDLRGVDLAVLPMGVCERHPLTGERRIHPEHEVLRLEATFVETLEIARQLEAKRVVLSHIEEMDGLSHDEWLDVGCHHGVEIAYDGLLLEV